MLSHIFMKRLSLFSLLLGIVLTLLPAGCQKSGSTVQGTDADSTAMALGPDFSADSAWQWCQEQCAFGPRTMNSTAHEQCKDWIVEKFRQYGCTVSEQHATLKGWDGTDLKATNIIATTSTDSSLPRIMLCAHYDSRPWADNDPLESNRHTPVMGANDGASGIAVMIEIARLIQADTTLKVAVDFVCFDAEDYGTPLWEGNDDEQSWALGARYWAQHEPYKAGNRPLFAILLDMVGGENATFYQEGLSLQYAPAIVDKVWSAAQRAGYSTYFPMEQGGFVTDDHVPVNRDAHVPCVDIIAFYPNCEQSSFGPTWHTVNDDMQHIDRQTLKAVGQTVLQVIYEM